MTFRAGTELTKFLKGINTGMVAVVPLDCDGVAADGGNFEWVDILRDILRINSSLPGHFIMASCAGTVETKAARRKQTLMPVIPFDQNVMDIRACNFLRERRCFICHGKRVEN